MCGDRDDTSSSERNAQLAGARQAEARLNGPGPTTHIRTPARAWTDVAQDMDALEEEIQRSIDRYYKWLIEMCQRTTVMDPGSSGERIGRLRRRRDREFDRLMRRHGALSALS